MSCNASIAHSKYDDWNETFCRYTKRSTSFFIPLLHPLHIEFLLFEYSASYNNFFSILLFTWWFHEEQTKTPTGDFFYLQMSLFKRIPQTPFTQWSFQMLHTKKMLRERKHNTHTLTPMYRSTLTTPISENFRIEKAHFHELLLFCRNKLFRGVF